jgi:molybdopterin molybdotransferase
MRGFSERSDVEAVESLLAGSTEVLESEVVASLEAGGRVLSEGVQAPVDVPAFERSAMDGYALRGEETFGATVLEPAIFVIVGECLPGRSFDGEVGASQAVRIMTGAPVPAGADAVVPVESCEERGETVAVSDAVPPRKHVGMVGEDVRKGSETLRRGRRLRPQDVALLSLLGVKEVACVRRPRVDVLATGDELLPAGSSPRDYHVVDSNSPLLSALVDRDGGLSGALRILNDRADELRAALVGSAADVILISGGSSVGQEDHAPGIVDELGSLDFHGVTMRPSSPAGGGRIDGRFVFLLPGNPVSCLCAYEFFAGPTIRGLGGRSRDWPHRRFEGVLGRKIVSQVGRTDYVRVEIVDGEVIPIATSGASILSSTVRAAGAVIVPRGSEGLAAGSAVEVLLYD